MMSGMMGGMVLGMGVVWLLIILILVLAAAALVKYLRQIRGCRPGALKPCRGTH